MAMILLEDTHPAVKTTVKRILSGENSVPYCCIRDFDGCEHYITVVAEEVEEPEEESDVPPPEPKKTVFISLKHTVDAKILNKFGNLQERLKDTVSEKGILQKEPEDEAFISTVAIPADHKDFDKLVDTATKLRVTALCAPFFAQFDLYLKDPTSVKPIALPYRDNESMYLYSPKGSSLCCTITISAPDLDDRLFTKNFLQTFADARKLDQSVSGAPTLSYSIANPPQDLPSGLAKEAESEEVFWVTFQLFKKQIEKPKDAEKTVEMLANFRNFVSYHIRCCRSNMHAKMRARVDTSMQVLNRAKTSTTGRAKVQIK